MLASQGKASPNQAALLGGSGGAGAGEGEGGEGRGEGGQGRAGGGGPRTRQMPTS